MRGWTEPVSDFNDKEVLKLLVCGSLFLAGPVLMASDEAAEILTIEADSEYGEYLAGECSTCHNPNASDDSTVPKIHGASRESIVDNLLAYKNGERDNTTMKGVAEKFSKEEIAALAVYLASIQPDKT